MDFYKCIYPSNHHWVQAIHLSQHFGWFLLVPSQSARVSQLLWLLLPLVILSFITHNNWITLFVFTCIDLPLLVFMLVRLIHVMCDSSFLFYIALQFSTVCLLALGHFQLLAIMIMLLWAFLVMPLIAQIDRNFVRCMSKYWLIRSWTVKFFSLKKSCQFSKLLSQFIPLPTVSKSSSCSTLLGCLVL